MTTEIAGVDLGGTKIFAARVQRDGDDATVTAEASRSTPPSSVDDIVAAIAEGVD